MTTYAFHVLSTHVTRVTRGLHSENIWLLLYPQNAELGKCTHEQARWTSPAASKH
jgi:hypothetical protein